MLTAQTAEIPDDSRHAAWAAELRPVGPVEHWIVARAARLATRVDRLADQGDAVEASGIVQARSGNDVEAAKLEVQRGRLRREEAAAERAVHQAIGLLARGRKAGTWVGVAEEIAVGRVVELPTVVRKPEPCDVLDGEVPVPQVEVMIPPTRWQDPSMSWRISNPGGDLPAALPTVHLRM